MFECTVYFENGGVKLTGEFPTRDLALDFARRIVSKGETYQIYDRSGGCTGDSCGVAL